MASHRKLALKFLVLWVCCASLNGAEPGATRLRLGYFPNLTHGQALYARATGELETHLGVPVEWTAFNAGPTAIEAVFGNAVNATFVGPSPTLNGHIRSHGTCFVVIVSSAPAIAIATSDGIEHIPRIYLRAARTLGTPVLAMPTRVILPAALPEIVTGLKLGWTLAWHGGVSAELIKSTVGLGYLLQMGRELNDASQVIGVMVLTIAIGLLLDRFLFGRIHRHILVRRGLARGQE